RRPGIAPGLVRPPGRPGAPPPPPPPCPPARSAGTGTYATRPARPRRSAPSHPVDSHRHPPALSMPTDAVRGGEFARPRRWPRTDHPARNAVQTVMPDGGSPTIRRLNAQAASGGWFTFCHRHGPGCGRVTLHWLDLDPGVGECRGVAEVGEHERVDRVDRGV